MRNWIGAIVLGLGAAGCGSSGSSFSCDYMKMGTHTCSDNSISSGDISVLKSACTQNGGTVGDACTHTGAVGGCKATASGNGGSFTSTNWYYSGMASDYMNACTAAKGTWVTP